MKIGNREVKDTVYLRPHLRGLIWQAYVAEDYRSFISTTPTWSAFGVTRAMAERRLARRLVRVHRRHGRRAYREEVPLDKDRDPSPRQGGGTIL